MSSPRDTTPLIESAARHERPEPESPPAPKRRGGYLRAIREPLRYRDFRLLFSGQLISVIGDQFFAVALPWFVLTAGGSPQDLGLILTAYGIPRVGTVLLGGVLADRWRPRRVMLLADAARVFVVAGLAALALVARPEFQQIGALAVVLGIFDGLFIPASWAVVPDVLPEDALQAGNSLSFSWTQLANLAGPSIAGLVVTAFQSGVALAIDAGTFLVSTLTLAAMRSSRPRVASSAAAAAEAEAVPGEASFWRFLLHSRLFQVILLIVVVLNLVLNGMLEVGLPALAKQTFQSGASGYGLMLTGFGGGALLGGLLGPALANIPHRGTVNLCIWGAQSLAIISIPLLGGLEGATVALALMGLCNGLGNVSFLTMIQQHLPRQLMGRFMGALAFCNFGLFPVSVALSGVVVVRFGAPVGIAACGALALLATIVALIPREVRRI
jgi:MFS family permease